MNETSKTIKEEALQVLRQGVCDEASKKIVRDAIKTLKGSSDFEMAREVIDEAMRGNWKWGPKDNVWLRQQMALSTYKDEELVPGWRYTRALEILDEVGIRDPKKFAPSKSDPRFETVPETLCLGGAIHKRMYEKSGVLEHLHEAIGLYRDAWEWSPEIDKGYGGVNAAYLLDFLALLISSRSGHSTRRNSDVEKLRKEARELRETMAEKIPQIIATKNGGRDPLSPGTQGVDYWDIATLAEIYLGLNRYDQLRICLDKVRGMTEIDNWQQQSTFQQLLRVVRAQEQVLENEDKDPKHWAEPWKTLARFFPKDAKLAFSCWRGKVGLALSGGGFRASLFHLGVLARLAETGVLPSVEVLSTVSGGSIVGAHYYLELQKLLEKRADCDISRQDYVELVETVQKDFIAGIQTNLRTRVISNLWCNLRMLVPNWKWIGARAYTRSKRIGELYEEELYARVADGRGTEPRKMEDLRIKPKVVQEAADAESASNDFKPAYSNWKRRAKVPILLLNTTSLNSGHNWHFTSTWMGESPPLAGNSIDLNPRYRRLYYWQAPTDELKQYRLGHAVAASACVPALFEPLEIEDLYPGRTVRLVDGGVHDNQGVAALLHESCDFIFCSDASGQMNDEPSPSSGTLGVPLRASTIQGDRVREAEYQDLDAKAKSRAIHGLFFVHLKEGLVPGKIDWIDTHDPTLEMDHGTKTYYDIDRDLQAKLAAIRTDLDTFTEVETKALMLSGYLMTEHQLKQMNEGHRKRGGNGTWGGFNIEAPRGEWDFLALESIMSEPPNSPDRRRQDLALQLEIGSKIVFKVWYLYGWLRGVAYVLALSIAGLIGWFIYQNWDETANLGSWTIGQIATGAVISAACLAFPVLNWLDPQKAVRGYGVKILTAIVGYVVAKVHLLIFDPLFKKRGRLERLMKLPPE